jgi:hypothetical protein
MTTFWRSNTETNSNTLKEAVNARHENTQSFVSAIMLRLSKTLKTFELTSYVVTPLLQSFAVLCSAADSHHRLSLYIVAHRPYSYWSKCETVSRMNKKPSSQLLTLDTNTSGSRSLSSRQTCRFRRITPSDHATLRRSQLTATDAAAACQR